MANSIGITGIFRHDQRVGGVYWVFENLLRGFSELLDDAGPSRGFDLTVFHAGVLPDCKDDRFRWVHVPNQFGRFAAEARIAAGPARRLDAALFMNYHTPLVTRAGRAVTIIHDLQYLHMPQFFGRTKRLWLKWCHNVSLRKCHRVVTISNAVKEDMLRVYGDRWDDRIEVIWNPVSIDRFAISPDDDEYDITGGRPFILCVSVDRPQKNLFRLVEAFAHVHQKFPDYCLVLAGQLRSQRRERRERTGEVVQSMPAAADRVEQLGLTDHVRITGFIEGAQLGSLYRNATMCVLPSLFEGFGMPAVESLAMGKPTLVSGLPVLREVTLNAAQYVNDPTDVAAIADGMVQIISNPDRFRPSAAIVNEVHRRFAPREVASRYLNVLTA
jgi:glycosyltransferase involved in cell wall biosynthesis